MLSAIANACKSIFNRAKDAIKKWTKPATEQYTASTFMNYVSIIMPNDTCMMYKSVMRRFKHGLNRKNPEQVIVPESWS